MTSAIRVLLQAAAYAAFMAFLGYFASMPAYQYADPDMASVKLSVSHATNRAAPCVRLTPEQIAALAANMRRTEACERARVPLILELDIDDHTVLDVNANPAGLWNDGPASIYERFSIPAGTHAITVRLRDSARNDGWDFESSTVAELQPTRNLTITFRPETGGFNFR